jgi:hypothetical protein
MDTGLTYGKMFQKTPQNSIKSVHLARKLLSLSLSLSLSLNIRLTAIYYGGVLAMPKLPFTVIFFPGDKFALKTYDQNHYKE